MKRQLLVVIFAMFGMYNLTAQIEFTTVKEIQNGDSKIIKIQLTEDVKQIRTSVYGLKTASPIPYTSFGIGWTASSTVHESGNFQVMYRVHKPGKGWSEWKEDDGFIKPEESEDGYYWTNLLFGIDEYIHDSLDFYVIPPMGEIIQTWSLVFMDMSSEVVPDRDYTYNTLSDSKSCPQIPVIIPRSEWCGAYTACHNPTYTPTYRTPTHAVIHHGASPNTYTDAYAVVRSYWNYHVNTNGWSDIGYNYLTDKYGNLYQGRHNPQMPTTDVHSAHAGNANPSSIGINYLGNSDVTYPTAIQNQTCTQFLAWWFNHKGFDPLSSASINLQVSGSAVLPRICGHRDVNPGGTTCPGDSLYALMSTIRALTNQIIINCSMPNDTIAPISSIEDIDLWQNRDFRITLTDTDNTNGSGVKYKFWNLSDFNMGAWQNNGSQGFVNDEFGQTLSNSWINMAGTWNATGGVLKQTTESSSNTNLYTTVFQESGKIYLYQWRMKITGTGSNRRAGIHFFCDDATLSNRNNSYMVYYRVDNNKVQIYKYVGNTMNLKTDDSYTINPDTWYDCKILFNTITGEISAFLNDDLVSTWTDTTPYTMGNSISLRTADCLVDYDDVRVYRNRTHSETITVGYNKMARFNSANASTAALNIISLSIDSTNNISLPTTKQLFIDTIKPTTTILGTTNFKSENFNQSITDSDIPSGIKEKFYLNADLNNGFWSANSLKGFIYEPFEYLSTQWIQQTGTWTQASGIVSQTNEALSNTNIYAHINHTLSDTYLYHYKMKIYGTGTNRRAGFHFMCDNPTLDNRGNSYFVWVRVESQQFEIYKVTNNVFTQVKALNFSNTANTWYDFKIIYTKATGRIDVYVDNQHLTSWTDSAPISTGDYVSFRSGNAAIDIDFLNTYRKRSGNVDITIGNSSSDFRFENPTPSTSAGLTMALSIDTARNISTIDSSLFNVDFSKPLTGQVNDGNSNDIDTTTITEYYYGNWSGFSDPNSGILEYFYSLGSAPGLSNVKTWTSNNTATSLTISNLSLQLGNTYYLNVAAKNGAGLMSDTISSDGIFITNTPTALFSVSNDTICVGESIDLTNESLNYQNITWHFENGTPSTSTLPNTSVTYNTHGTFSIKLIAEAYGLSDTLIQHITVLPLPSITTNSPLTICLGDSVLMQAFGGASYLWSNSNPMVSPTTNSIYTVTGTSQHGCTSTSSVSVNVVSPPQIDIATTLADCGLNNGTASIQTTESYTYQWSASAGSGTGISTNGIAAGSHHITVSNGICSRIFPFNISEVGAPQLTIWAYDTTLCINYDSAYVYVSGADEYLWSGPEISSPLTGTHIQAYPTVTSTYTVQGTSNGCSSFAELTIIVNYPTPLVCPDEKSVCLIAPYPLNDVSPSGGSYYGNGVSNNIFSPTTVGPSTQNISYRYFNEFGCRSDCYYSITVLSNPTVYCNDTSVCIGTGTFTLDSGLPQGGTYSGNGVVNNQFNSTNASIGNNVITYLYHDQHQCSAACSFIINVTGGVQTGFTTQEQGLFVAISNQATPLNATISYNMGDGTWKHEASPTHTYSAPGQYTITQVVSNECFADSVSHNITLTSVGIDDNLENQIKIFPNPTTNFINIDWTQLVVIEEIKLINAIGQLVYERQTQTLKSLNIDVTSLPSGVYSLYLHHKNGVIPFKIMIIKAD